MLVKVAGESEVGDAAVDVGCGEPAVDIAVRGSRVDALKKICDGCLGYDAQNGSGRRHREQIP